jgi:exodeoxyribonuclease VII large subunit
MEYAQNKEITLSELNLFIRKLINEEIFATPLWIVAEISEMKTARNGHCYLELVEKQNDKIVAKSRATIWSSRCPILKDYFE